MELNRFVCSPPFEKEELEHLLDPELIKKRREADRGLYTNRDRDWPEDAGGRGSGQVGSGAPGMQPEGGGRGGGGGGGGRPKRDMSAVLCFKVSTVTSKSY